MLTLNHEYITGDLTAPLYLMIHGRAGNLHVMSIFRKNLPEGANVLTIEAPYQDPDGGWSWWIMSEPQPKIQQQMADSKDAILRAVTEQRTLHSHTGAVIPIGFSQGALMISIIMQNHPILFAKSALLAGYVYEIAEPQRPPIGTKVFLANGRDDPIVPIARAERSVKYLQELGYEVELVVDDNIGHKIGLQGMRRLKEWLLTNL